MSVSVALSVFFPLVENPMKFVDQVKIFVKSGAGGGGCVSFRREKFVEHGGPNGGDGGRGGNVEMRAVSGLNTLVDYRYSRHFKAGRGIHGMGRNMTGATGKDIVMEVPVGTQVYDEDMDFLIVDLAKEGDKIIIARGGHGGLGNTHFKSSTNRAPRRASPGGESEERWLVLRLKLLADAGLVGLPNAGKSTFLAAVTKAKPKIADYPFTTLAPQLGVAGVDTKEFVIADIPGLIEGAAEGVGLGHRFLGHVERCAILLHLIDGTQDDLKAAYDTIMKELKDYNLSLLEKPMILGLNKIDSIPDEMIAEKVAELEAISGQPVLPLSGVSGAGTDIVLRSLLSQVEKTRADMAASDSGGAPDSGGEEKGFILADPVDDPVSHSPDGPSILNQDTEIKDSQADSPESRKPEASWSPI